MTKLLLFGLIIFGIGFLILSFLKRALKGMFGNFQNPQTNIRRDKEETKSKIIYKSGDVVVMKGDASKDIDNNNNP